MRIIEGEYLPFLTGTSFDKGLKFPLRGNTGFDAVIDRLSFLANLANGKTVIHWGCCDHVPLIEQKLKSGTWLHKILTDNAIKCHGVDICSESVESVKKLGFENVSLIDETMELPKEILDSKWDYVVAGEILEHTSKPVEFLSELRQKLSGCAADLLITVPNAFQYENFQNCLCENEFECINSDHRFWFTPYTLAKIISDAGLKPAWFGFVTSNLINNIPANADYLSLIEKHPAFRSTIVFCAKI